MDILKTKYCNNNGYLIKNNRNKYNILKYINSIMGTDILNKNYKIYSDRLEHILKNRHTLVTYLSIGKPVFLYLTKINGENITLIIEKEKNTNNLYPKIVAISLCLKGELYSNTLISAELYKLDDEWFILLDSVYMYKNKKVIYSYKNNVEVLNNITKDYPYSELDSCKIIIKKYFTPDKIEDFINSTNIKLKGLKFVNRSNIHFYFNKKFINYNRENLYKLPENCNIHIKNKIKELEKNIIESRSHRKKADSKKFILNLKTSKSYGIYDLFCDKNKYMGIARIETIEISQMIINKLKTVNSFNVSTVWDYNFNKFKIIGIDVVGELTNYKNITAQIT